MDLARTIYSRDLKLTVMHALDAGTTVNEVARKHQLAPKLIERWRGEWRAKGLAAFPGVGFRGAGSMAMDDAGRIAELERKIGQMAMENDVLKKALQRLKVQARPIVADGTDACSTKSVKLPRKVKP